MPISRIEISQDRSETRPASDASPVTALSGLLGVGLAWWLAGHWSTEPLETTLLFILLPASVMILVDLAVFRVHRRSTTGLTFDRNIAFHAESLVRASQKAIAYYAVWVMVGLAYWLLKEYSSYRTGHMLELGRIIATIAVLAAPVYIYIVDQYQIDPHDDAWHFGQFLLRRPYDRSHARAHLTSTALRAFFLPFLLGAVSDLYVTASTLSFADALRSPHILLYYFLDRLWLLDTVYAVIGYLVCSRLLDTHIRDTYRSTAAWLVTLVCYPPYNDVFFTGTGYYENRYWDSLIPLDTVLGAVWMVLIALSCAIYISANLVFGLRFSNLSKRGIVTSGPYALMKHPAYFFKSLSWWLMYVPFTMVSTPAETVRACLLMALGNFIYYLRACYEEQELRSDPKYQAYCAYIEQYGIVARVKSLFR